MNRFRIAAEADVSAVLPLMRQYYAEDGYEFDEMAARRALLDLIRDERLGRLWVAEIESIVGYLAVTLGFSLEYRGRDAFIDELFVEQSSRGIGLGREALAIAESYSRDAGVRALHLEVEPARKAARGLYRATGFEVHSRYLMTKLLG
jgi:GNAT superfamily N-acetyltransferase